VELVVHIQDQETLAAALAQVVGGVAASLPRTPDSRVWRELREWRTAARSRGIKFLLTWDWLVREPELPGVADLLQAVVGLDPDGVQLRDLGLVREARRRYPHLALQAAGNLGLHNSPGMRLAASLGFTRVAVAEPISLKDLALIRRQTTMPLVVNLLGPCPGYPGLCLLEEYLGINCAVCCLARPVVTPRTLIASLETFSGLCQLDVEAVQITGELLPPASLAQVIGLYQTVAAAAPMERPRVLAAARQVIEAFAEALRLSPPAASGPPAQLSFPSHRPPARPRSFERRRLWLEGRDYPEAAALARQWRETLLLALTPDNYAAFLQEHRRWGPRRLIWRLPPAIPESALAFYQKALETLGQGGYNRFVAGDWGSVALAAAAGGHLYGDQTLGLRNSWSVQAARDFKLSRVCLPPGNRPEHWRDILAAAPSASFWSYLYRVATLAVCPATAADLAPPEPLRWVTEDGKALLKLKAPVDLRHLGTWFRQQAISPLVVSLPHSPQPSGRLPAWLGPHSSPSRREKIAGRRPF
jgi:collagenase-like PrtC family protease